LKQLKDNSTLFDDHLIYKSVGSNGYGNIIKFHGKCYNAHVLSYICSNQSLIPKGMLVRHKCRYPLCIESSHLEIGTPQQNSYDDKIRDGTLIRGEKHYNAKITKDQAIEILNSKGEGSQKDRANRFQVSIHIIKDIDRGKTWTELGESQQKRKKCNVKSPTS